MGTPRDVVAGGRVYSVVDDIAVVHRLAFRVQLTDAASNKALTAPVRAQPLDSWAFALVQPGAKCLVAVAADPATVRITFRAPGYTDKTVELTVPAAAPTTETVIGLDPLPA